jgi:GNAT superfamily N-acetyltransferase
MSEQIHLTEIPSTPWLNAINSLLAEYNRRANPTFLTARELPQHAPRPLIVVTTNSHDDVIAGLIGETQFAWLKISIMAVAEPSCRQGIGRSLLEAAEIESIRRGCSHAYVDTMDYQAPGFYERMGYAVAGRLENWDSHGHSKLFLTKRLVSTEGA